MKQPNNNQQLAAISHSAIEFYQGICNLPVSAGTSTKQIYKLETGQISALCIEEDRQQPITIIKLLLTDFGDYFGVTFTDHQLTEFAKTFYDKFFYWHLADLKNFYECCKGLNFGKPYGTVTVATIMEWGNEYNRQRDEQVQSIINEEYHQLKAQEKR